MLNIQKASSDKTRLRYFPSFSTCGTSSNVSHDVIFVPLCKIAYFENNDSKIDLRSEVQNNKEKSILGAPPKVVKKEGKQNSHHSTNKKN